MTRANYFKVEGEDHTYTSFPVIDDGKITDRHGCTWQVAGGVETLVSCPSPEPCLCDQQWKIEDA